MKRIASRDNPHVRALRKLLQSGRERRKSGLLLLDGMHLVDAYRQRVGIPDELLVSDSGASRAEIAAYLAGAACRTTVVTVLADALFNELTVVDSPSGIMAVAKPPPPCPLDDSADSVLVDGVQDPGNLGALLRSAAAAGFRQVLLSADCAQAWSPKTLRAAMGAHFFLDPHENIDLAAFLAAYRGRTVTTALSDAHSLYAIDLTGPLAWVFGSEGQGVRPAVAAATQLRLCIPMPGAVESLNVAAAAAVCLFETVRQRRAADASVDPTTVSRR